MKSIKAMDHGVKAVKLAMFHYTSTIRAKTGEWLQHIAESQQL